MPPPLTPRTLGCWERPSLPSSTRWQAAPGLPSMGSEPTPSGEGPADPAPWPFAGRREQGGPLLVLWPPPPCPSSSASGLDVRSSSRRSRLRPGLLGLFTFGGSKLRATRAVSISKGRLGTTACACAPVSPRRSLNRRRADAGREPARHPSPALRERAPMKTLTRASESRVINPNPKGGGRGALMTITSAGLAKLTLLDR